MKIFASTGGTTLAEYTEYTHTVPSWTKSYTYFGDTQLATVTPNGTGGEYVEFNHPDRLGTKVITNQVGGTAYQQTHLPFGTALNAESTGSTNNRFTSYDRSAPTGLDYAVNRTYDSKQGRFTQVDPIGMQAVDFQNPQTLNLYNYCANDPINHLDPDGLFFGKLFNWLKKALKWIMVAISIAIAVVTIIYAPVLFTSSLKLIFGLVGAISSAASTTFKAFGLTALGNIFGVIGAFASFGTSVLKAIGEGAAGWKSFFDVISTAASATSQTLSALGYNKLAKIFGLVSTTAGFISSGLKADAIKDETTKEVLGHTYSWTASGWDTYKFVRSASEQVASIAGADRVAGFFNAVGLIDDGVDLYLGFKNFYSPKGNPGAADKIYRLNFMKNKKTQLTGWDSLGARFALTYLTVLRRTSGQLGRGNRILSRSQRAYAITR